MRIVIVGAGVAGCVMARKLSRLRGVEVVCLERVQRDDHSEAGTGLNIGPNAVKALTSVDPELADLITQASFPWRHWLISLTDGTVLFDQPLADVADGPGWRIRWSGLYHVLREAADTSVLPISVSVPVTTIRRLIAPHRSLQPAQRAWHAHRAHRHCWSRKCASGLCRPVRLAAGCP